MKEQVNCIIIHGCPSNSQDKSYNRHWMPWTKQEITSKGIKAETPLMPEPWKPNYDKFKREFEKNKVNENSILIGHSCGCAFLVRWLGESKKKITKLILVAPWKIPKKNDKSREEFYTYDIDETIKKRVKEIVMFTSDDEEKEGKKSLEIYHKALGGKIISLKEHGHYTFGDMKTDKFPELIKEVI